MASYYLAKVSRGDRSGLIPTDQESGEFIRKLSDGECVHVAVTKVRSYQWHKLYKGLCRTIGQNQDPTRDGDSIDYELRVLAGHYDMFYARKGNQLYEVRTPKRIAFDKLTADQWRDLWPSLELAGRERFGEEYFDQVNVA